MQIHGMRMHFNPPTCQHDGVAMGGLECRPTKLLQGGGMPARRARRARCHPLGLSRPPQIGQNAPRYRQLMPAWLAASSVVEQEL